jgi:hypothetical protein
VATISVPPEVRDKAMVMKEDLGYDNIGDFVADVMTFIEDNLDAFDEAFPVDDEDIEDEDEE